MMKCSAVSSGDRSARHHPGCAGFPPATPTPGGGGKEMIINARTRASDGPSERHFSYKKLDTTTSSLILNQVSTILIKI